MAAVDWTGTRCAAAAIDRRSFLRLSAAMASSFAARRRQTPAASSDPVVVVGAGLAGLRAADLLRKAGTPVVVLEARNRPGGRVFTIRRSFSEGLYAEAGAIRIPPQHDAVVQLTREHGLNLVPFESLA